MPTSELPVLNPFFSEETDTPEVTENEDSEQYEPVAADSQPATTKPEKSRPTMILVNETASRSHSPESSSESIKNPNQQNQDHKIFDLRAILDSDSD